MRKGTVTRWINHRGFGFVRPADGGKEIFVHLVVVKRCDIADVYAGLEVEFEDEVCPRTGKPRVCDIRIVSGEQASEDDRGKTKIIGCRALDDSSAQSPGLSIRGQVWRNY